MEKWSKDEMSELKKFWEGKIGKKYIQRMEDTKKQLLQASMGSTDPDSAFRYSCIANGFDSVLQDIEAVINMDKKEAKGEKKSKQWHGLGGHHSSISIKYLLELKAPRGAAPTFNARNAGLVEAKLHSVTLTTKQENCLWMKL